MAIKRNFGRSFRNMNKNYFHEKMKMNKNYFHEKIIFMKKIFCWWPLVSMTTMSYHSHFPRHWSVF